jgi:cytochrome b subunit of formate dehydrogenase
MNKKLHYLGTALLFLAFVTVGITGIIKFQWFFPVTRYVYTVIPARTLSLIHDWAGISLVILAIIHIVFYWKVFANMVKGLFSK